MKIRNGFVSNSSSSMFVVAFPHKPTSAKEVQLMMFNGYPFLSNPYDDGKTETKTIAQTVWEDIKPQKRWKQKRMEYEVKDALAGDDGEPDYELFKIIPKHITELEYDGKTVITARPSEKYDWDKYYIACDEHTQKITGELLKGWKDKIIYVFSYGDDDGDYYSILEHGGIFYNLPHKQISKH